MLNPTLDYRQINFDDPAAVVGFVSRLCQAGSDCGMAAAEFAPSCESNEVRRVAAEVVRNLDRLMPSMTPANAFHIVEAYDLAHRLAYATPADANTLNAYVLRAFDAMLHGDNAVDRYDMFRTIRRAIARRDRAYFDRPLQWTVLVEEQWYREAKAALSSSAHAAYGKASVTDYDIINRTAILLQSDLYAYEGSRQTAFKQALFALHRHYLDTPGAEATPYATALRHLLSASAPYLSPATYTSYATRLFTFHPVA